MRRGYTLFEILLVVALIAILSGMLVPGLIESAYGDRTHLQAAADQIAGKWSAMRARAIVEGRPYRFSYQQGTGDFRVSPDGSDLAGGGDSQGGNGGGLVVNDSLPPGILFTTMNAATPTAEGGSDSGNGGASSDASPAGATAAVFLPDGTGAAGCRDPPSIPQPPGRFPFAFAR